MSQEKLVEYFIEQTNDRLERMEDKMDKLLAFKWQIIGGSVAISALVGLVGQVFMSK
jgi:hypothetical protein